MITRLNYRAVLLRGLVMGLCVAMPLPTFGQDTLSMNFFPGNRIFPRFTADGLEHTLSLSKVAEDREWIGTIGASVPLLQLNTNSTKAQLGLAVTTFNGLIKPPGHLDVYTIDYRVDIPLDVRFGALALRAGPGHISSHFADDAIELLGKHSIQVVKDYIAAGASYDFPSIGGYVYGRTDYIYHFVPYGDLHWQFQVGGEVGNFLLAGFVRPYAAIDIKMKQQVGWGTTESYQLGARFFVKRDLPVRVAYTYRTGYDERGQFFDQKTDGNLFSVYLDL